MKTKKFFKTIAFSIPVLFLSVFFTFRLVFAQSNVIYVDKNGSQAPDGSSTAPYQLIEAGMCAVQPNSTVMIRGGNYNELLTLDKPATLTAFGGPVVIGQVEGKAHTTLKILTYNTHLFGNTGLGFTPDFHDDDRARQIAVRVNEEDADVVALEEVWDGDLANAIISRAAYPYTYYNDETDEFDDFIGSGLLLLSKYPLVHAQQIFYKAEAGCGLLPSGCDGWASKGFVKATIEKEGFQIAVFITHTDASDEGARRKQIAELGWAIFNYRLFYPHTQVIAMGDFNINAKDPDYSNTLLRFLSLHDAVRNAACFKEENAFTERTDNDLWQMWNSASTGEEGKRLDYVFYSPGSHFDIFNSAGSSFDMLPTYADVRDEYKASPPIEGHGDLSDHYGVVVEFSIYR